MYEWFSQKKNNANVSFLEPKVTPLNCIQRPKDEKEEEEKQPILYV